MKLSTAMRDSPNETEVAILQAFVNRAMEIKVQMDEGYKGDKNLRDRLGESLNIPDIKGYLKDRLARFSQHLINRVAIELSDRPLTAESTYTTWVPEVQDRRDYENAMYSLGKSYGGGAKNTPSPSLKGKNTPQAQRRQRAEVPATQTGMYEGCWNRLIRVEETPSGQRAPIERGINESSQ